MTTDPYYKPGCSCNPWGLEPDENCHNHGWPDHHVCVACGQFKALDAPCKRCGHHNRFCLLQEEAIR